ncbi:MAG: M28 family peptidase [Pseudomonadota bacterium]
MLHRAALIALVASASTAMAADGPPDWWTEEMATTSRALAAQGLEDRIGYEMVEDLTTRIGPRVAGTPEEARARDWAVDYLTDLGFENVRIEPFDVRLWKRGAERVEIVSPYPQPIVATTLGHSVGTPEGGVEGEIVRFPSLPALEAAPVGGLEGKIVFVDEPMTRTMDGSGYGVAVRKRSGAAVEAGKRGALGALIRSVGTQAHRMPHTGGMYYAKDITPVPIAAISPPDADQLARMLELDEGPVVVSMELRATGGGRTDAAETGGLPGADILFKAPSGNVVAEIPGETDEIVIVGAHLDSWDLGTGAIDDGAGVGIVTAAAKLVGDLPDRPTRTIRVVLFGSEEVGLVGARAYAQQHAGELDKHVIGAESDFGADRIWRFQTRWGDKALTEAKALFLAELAPLGVLPGDNKASGGPDMSPLRQAGVPVATLGQNGLDYFDLHHTPDDTFDKIDPDAFAQNVAAYAVFIHIAANAPVDFRE